MLDGRLRRRAMFELIVTDYFEVGRDRRSYLYYIHPPSTCPSRGVPDDPPSSQGNEAPKNTHPPPSLTQSYAQMEREFLLLERAPKRLAAGHSDKSRLEGEGHG